ncbi:MAG TPA: GNAT family N-acetyltransferase [Coleofasciculaceae cyanobacterium]
MVEQLQPRYTVSWIDKIADVPQAEWDALAMPLKTPFLEWEWLHNMETSGSVGDKTGWLPCHLILRHGRRLIAAAPLYLKGHSYGEFVFDHQWADLAQRLGIRYYPKLLGMSPFTPVEGYRFLVAPDEDELEITERLVEAIDQFCVRNRISGCHFLYTDPQWRQLMEQQCGFTRWLHHSYIWSNQSFQTFEDYLGAFNANQRRNIKRERKAVAQAGLSLQPLTGEQLTPALLSSMYDFYSDTCDKFGWWGSKYLTRQFFEQLYPRYSHRVVLFAVHHESEPDPIGMSFCLTKGDQLYGRYWGAFQDVENLHFETCYYTPIDWAIAHNIQTFDPGAGGKHKKRRGFPATPNYSLHRFYNPRLTQILETYIAEVNQMEQKEIEAINEDIPFKQP